MLSITPIYAAIIAAFYVVLSVRTLRARGHFGIALGDGANATLKRLIRAHGNCQEYVPTGLLLAAFFESYSPLPYFVHGVCACLLFGRLAHAYGISQVQEPIAFRVAGMALTFTSIIGSSLGIIACALLSS